MGKIPLHGLTLFRKAHLVFFLDALVDLDSASTKKWRYLVWITRNVC